MSRTPRFNLACALRAITARLLALSWLLSCIAVPVAGAAEIAASAAPQTSARAAELVHQGQRYENAEGVTRDQARALDLYCEAALMNDGEAFLRMGWMYANARGVERNDSIAGQLLQRAAALGNPVAARLTALIRGSGPAAPLPDCLRPAPTRVQTPAQSRAEIAYDLDFDDPRRAGVVRPLMSAALQARLQAPLARLAREYRLDPGLVLAVMRAESGFDPQARSIRNAQGLMQLIPETAERFAVRNAFDPVENLRGGMRYLRWLLSYFEGDVRLALAGYNAGEGAVDRARGVPPWPETRQYIERIRGWYPHEFHPFEAQVTDPAPWLRKQSDATTAQETRTVR